MPFFFFDQPPRFSLFLSLTHLHVHQRHQNVARFDVFQEKESRGKGEEEGVGSIGVLHNRRTSISSVTAAPRPPPSPHSLHLPPLSLSLSYRWPSLGVSHRTRTSSRRSVALDGAPAPRRRRSDPTERARRVVAGVLREGGE